MDDDDQSPRHSRATVYSIERLTCGTIVIVSW